MITLPSMEQQKKVTETKQKHEPPTLAVQRSKNNPANFNAMNFSVYYPHLPCLTRLYALHSKMNFCICKCVHMYVYVCVLIIKLHQFCWKRKRFPSHTPFKFNRTIATSALFTKAFCHSDLYRVFAWGEDYIWLFKYGECCRYRYR